MAMTLAEYQDEVRENVKRDVNGLPNSRITRWVNWAQRYLSDLHTYEEMRDKFTGATVVGQTDYGFPTNMKDIYTVNLQNTSSSSTLKYVPARLFDSMIPYPSIVGTGQPTHYVDYGKNFELYPIPDAIYSIIMRASIYPSDLSLSTDVSTLLGKDALLCAMATTFGFYSLREIEDAAYWGGELVATLYASSLASDHSAEDWVPVARGFSTQSNAGLVGEWWKSPFTGRNL